VTLPAFAAERYGACCSVPEVRSAPAAIDLHHESKKNKTTFLKLLAITSSIIIRFFKFFSLKDSVVNLQQTLFKHSTTLETCRYTIL